MGVSELILLTEATFLVFGVIFSFFVFIPISTNTSEFEGRCLLYAQGIVTGKSSEAPTINVTVWGNLSVCNYSVVMGVVIFLWSLLILAFTSAHLIRGTDWSWFWSFVTMCGHALLFVMILGSAFTVSMGFRSWCSTITLKHQQCRDVQVYIGTKVDTTDFYILYTIAIIGCWAIWLSYLALLVTSVRRLCLYHKIETFPRRMRRETNLLLHRWRTDTDYQSV